MLYLILHFLCFSSFSFLSCVVRRENRNCAFTPFFSFYVLIHYIIEKIDFFCFLCQSAVSNYSKITLTASSCLLMTFYSQVFIISVHHEKCVCNVYVFFTIIINKGIFFSCVYVYVCTWVFVCKVMQFICESGAIEKFIFVFFSTNLHQNLFHKIG